MNKSSGHISRRSFLASLGAGAALLAAGRAMAQQQPQKPNVVFIMADDLGYGDLSCYGNPKVRTVNCDRLAREGRRFTDAHTPSGVCSPTRYGLLTGRYPWRVDHVHPVLDEDAPLAIGTDELTLGKLFQNAGYATGCIGKWHLGLGDQDPINWNKPLRPGPNDVGFDYYFGAPVGNWTEPYVWVENDRVVGMKEGDQIIRFGNNPWVNTVDTVRDRHQIGPILVNKATEFIKKHRDEPFFLYLPTCAIHRPIEPAPIVQGTSEAGPYGDYVHDFDWTVGEVRETLERLGIAENTIIIVTSDNGGVDKAAERLDTGHDPSGGLRGYKSLAYEGGHRVPFIAWGPSIPAGTESGEVICLSDMIATFAVLLGVALPPEAAPDSINVLPALLGQDYEGPLHEGMVAASVYVTRLAMRWGDWKYIDGPGGGGGPERNRKAKPDDPPCQLYNLAEDLQETTNVYQQHPEVVEHFETTLARYKEQGYSRPR